MAMLTGDPEPRVATRPVDDIVNSLSERGISAKYLELVAKTLQPEPSERPSLRELLDALPSHTARL